jgi:excisionase family DNA binding protein
MKSTLEPEDIQTIADSIVHKLKPHFAIKPVQSDNLMDIEELCAYLKVSKQWVYERTHLKQIPYIKLSNKGLRFRKKDIDQWLESLKTPQVNEYKKMTFFMVA